MLNKEKPELIYEQQKLSIHQLRENISRIIQGTVWKIQEILKENTLIDFLLGPWKYLDMLPDIYEKNPKLKLSPRLRNTKK